MRPETKSHNLNTALESYLKAPGETGLEYPELRLEFLGEDHFKDNSNFCIQSLKLKNQLYLRLVRSTKELDDSTALDRYVGTQIKLKKWSFKTTLLGNQFVIDLDVKVLE